MNFIVYKGTSILSHHGSILMTHVPSLVTTRQFTEAVNADIDDVISRHRFSPYTAYYLKS